jgi:hypothetical protein
MITRASLLGCLGGAVFVLWLGMLPQGLAGKEAQPAPSPAAASGEWGLDFDGVDDRVVIDKFRYDGSFPITMEAVVLPTKDVKGSVFVDFELAGIGLHLYGGEKGDRRWKLNVRDELNYRVASADEKAELGRAVHLAGVFDGKTVSLFVNGKPQARTGMLQGKFVPSGLPFYVGSNPRPDGGFHECFAGQIDAVRLSRGVRYEKPFQPPQKFEKDDNTLVLLNFEEGQGEKAADESGNGYHGTVVGAKWLRIEPAKP